MSLKVFISYAKEDSASALQCYDFILQVGALPWLDSKKILPGQNWEVEIEKAFSDANVVILLMSKTSVSKRGFVQREAIQAMENLRYRPADEVYVIPVLIESCDVPDNISRRLQYVNLQDPEAWKKIGESLDLAANQQAVELSAGVLAGPLKVFDEVAKESNEGKPGSDIDIEYPRFKSLHYPEMARELDNFFIGRTARALLESREKPWFQDHEVEGGGANQRWDRFRIAYSSESCLSIVYVVAIYFDGAAHPNSYTETFNFYLADKPMLLKLEDFFEDDTSAIKKISELCISRLGRQYCSRTGEMPDEEQLNWFKEGAAPDEAIFNNFIFNSEGLTFLFDPYQVAPYGLGGWSVDISFSELTEVLRVNGPHTLPGEKKYVTHANVTRNSYTS